MMLTEHFKMAFSSIRSARFRSALTMFGIIVGISSVVTIVSLGEGVKQQVSGQIKDIGANVLIIQPGRGISSENRLSFLPGASVPTGTLSAKDLEAVNSVQGIDKVAPIAYVSATPRFDQKTYENALVIASNEHLADILKQRVAFGTYLEADSENRRHAVIGRSVADNLFEEKVPMGKRFTIQGEEFLVIGVFEPATLTNLSYSVDFNEAIVVPYSTAQSLDGTQLFEILIKTDESVSIDETIEELTASIATSRDSNSDFRVLRQEDAIAAADDIFYQITIFVAGVAVISLLVGGIGIMNIMFATVSERTREIGIRKAIGATNQQIMGQFLTEAIVLSIVGCIIGVIVSLGVNVFLRVTTNLEPTLTPMVLIISVAVAAATGILSGILPAAKAAQKDPIEALRYDR